MKKIRSLLPDAFHYIYALTMVGAMIYVVFAATTVMGTLLAGFGGDEPSTAMIGLLTICLLPFAALIVFLMLILILLAGKFFGWFVCKIHHPELGHKVPFGPTILIPLAVIAMCALGSDPDSVVAFMNMVDVMSVFAKCYGALVLMMLIIGRYMRRRDNDHKQDNIKTATDVNCG